MALLSLSLCLVSVIISLVTSPVTGVCKTSGVKLENNGYTGIVVAIHEDEPENPALIDAIKEMFISGSAYLFTATKHRTYFKEVTILIPLSWPDNPSYTAPGKATFEGADIIVAAHNPTNSPGGDSHAIPYTEHFAGCGEQALHIHMTSSFLLNADQWSPLVGDNGRVLVLQWGHYRWGLFNESPSHIRTPDEKNIYYSRRNSKWEPVRCTSDWLFDPLKYTKGPSPTGNPTHRACHGDETVGYEEGCLMIPRPRQPSHITGSLMNSQLQFDQIVNFCDNNQDDPGSLHNSEAPTTQNERCDGKSCWEVMREHSDFKGNTDIPLREGHDVTPTFSVVRSKITRIVLVMDTSGSMRTSYRYLKIADAARTFLLTMAAPGTFVGIVDFDGDATIISYLTEMTSDTVRRTLANRVPENASGGTCIGCGLEEALKILLRADGDPGGSKILLMTDGVDGNRARTRLMLDRCIRYKVIIDAVAITNAATQNLVELTAETGGQFYLQTDESTSTGLPDALSVNSRGASRFHTREKLRSAGVSFEVDQTSTYGIFYIEEAVGRLTTIDFSYFRLNPSGRAAVEIRLYSPTGQVFSRRSPSYEDDLQFKKVTIRIPGTAEAGRWSYFIFNRHLTEAHTVVVSVTSFPSLEGVDPITVSSFVCGSVIRILDSKAMAVRARVRQRFNPVVGARVIAKVERPNGVPVELQLFDNGAGADLTKNDGIYSRYFTQFDGAGYYGYSVRVFNDGRATILRRSSLFSETGIYIDPELLLSGNVYEYLGDLSIALPGAPIPEIVGVPAPYFDREVSGGAGTVSETPPEWDPSIDTFAPNKITDLAVLNTSFSLGIVTINFTAPGDDFDFGNAHHYEIRWATSSQELRSKSSTTHEIYQTDVLHGNLYSPAPYGVEEIMRIRVPTFPQHIETYSVMLGLYAVDESGNEGDMSNVARVTFRKMIPTPEPVQTTTREPAQNCDFWYHPFLGVFLPGDCYLK